MKKMSKKTCHGVVRAKRKISTPMRVIQDPPRKKGKLSLATIRRAVKVVSAKRA